jgi:phospholipid/cholesterol/gamma-HCH transport system substrate-binding protein
MPSPQRVSWSKLRVGITALVAMIMVGVLIFLLTTSGNFLKQKVVLRTYVEDASGTALSAPVDLNGIPIGNVKDIRLSGSSDPKRAVEFILEIKGEYLKDIPEDSVAAISASNLLGNKIINITRGKSSVPVQPGAELRSAQVQDIPELMAESANVIQTFQDILKRLDGIVGVIEGGHGTIGKFVKDEELYTRLNAIAAQGQQLLSDVRNGKGTLSHILYDDSLYQEIRSPLRRIDDLLGGLQKGQGSAGKLMKDPALVDDLDDTVKQIRALVATINSTKGTVGQLLNNDQLSRQMNQLVAKLDHTVDRLESGQGTLGQLLVNPQLYDTLNATTHEMQSLLRDMHANPKKFLTIQLKLF